MANSLMLTGYINIHNLSMLIYILTLINYVY